MIGEHAPIRSTDMTLRKAARRRPAPETAALPAEAQSEATAPAASESPPAAASNAPETACAQGATPALAAAGPLALLALARSLGQRRQAALAAAVVAMVMAGALVGHALAPSPGTAGGPGLREVADAVTALRADLVALNGRLDGVPGAADLQALERRIVSMRESVERTRTELSAAASLPAGAVEQLRQQQAASAVQVQTQVGRIEDALRDLAKRVEGLEPQAAGPLVTGSLPSPKPAVAAVTPAAPATSEGGTTVQAKSTEVRPGEGRTAAQQAERTPDRERPVVNGWFVHDVRRGVALVEGPGGLFEVGKGQAVPGLGRVEAIERRGRGWALLTTKGLVETAPW